jgi:adenylate cyclase
MDRFWGGTSNLLAEFGSVVLAVECAVEIQRELKEKNEALAENRRMQFRIGINLGDVIVEGERLYGDGVNIAARLEGLSEGGGICISGGVHEQVHDKLPLGYEDLGGQEVKNIAKPVRAYRVLMDPEAVGPLSVVKWAGFSRNRWVAAVILAIPVIGGVAAWNFSPQSPRFEPASAEKMAFPLPKKPSIAVLPFDNLSGDPKQGYLGDGIAESIITALSRVPEIFVIARTSTLSYKGKAVKVQQVAEELGVRYVLDGSVQKSGTKVRINVQLIDALKGHHLWAKSYDRNLKDAFTLQDDITQKVVAALKVKLSEGERARIRRIHTENAEAYQYVRLGKNLIGRFTKESNAEAQGLFEKAVSLDSQFASGWVWLGYTYQFAAKFGWGADPVQDGARAGKLARKALAVDPSNPDAYQLLVVISLHRREFEKAITYGKRAVALAPSHAGATALLGRTLVRVGRPKEALPLIQRAIRLRPHTPSQYFRYLGYAYRSMGRYKEAIAAFERARARNPKSKLPYIWLAMTYGDAGLMKKARKATQEILKGNSKFSSKEFVKTLDYKDPAENKRALASMRKAGLPE